MKTHPTKKNKFQSLGKKLVVPKYLIKEVKGGSLTELERRLPPNSQKVYNNVKSDQILSVSFRRQPVAAAINGLLDALSLGKFSNLQKENNIDQFFHLSAILNYANRKILIEKNEVINIQYFDMMNFGGDIQGMSVKVQPGITLEQCLENMKQSMGDEKLFIYDAFSSNCQDFMVGLENALGVATPEITAWIKQPVDKLAGDLPDFTRKIAKVATNLGNKAQELYQGSWLEGVVNKVLPASNKQLDALELKDWLIEYKKTHPEVALNLDPPKSGSAVDMAGYYRRMSAAVQLRRSVQEMRVPEPSPQAQLPNEIVQSANFGTKF